jgi:hypothetical protein
MTKATPTLALLFLSALACGPGHPSGDTAMQDTPMPDLGQAESLGDPWHCGELDLVCIGPLGIGSCVDGECGGWLSDCYQATGTCAEICATEGRVCDELGCDGATAWRWTASSLLEAYDLCGSASHQTVEPMFIGCGDELEGLTTALSCCCQTE